MSGFELGMMIVEGSYPLERANSRGYIVGKEFWVKLGAWSRGSGVALGNCSLPGGVDSEAIGGVGLNFGVELGIGSGSANGMGANWAMSG